MKIITICGSMKFFNEIEKIKYDLEKLGFEIYLPNNNNENFNYHNRNYNDLLDKKQFYIDIHIDKIRKSDAVLIVNFTKDDIQDRIGGNSFLEIGFAYILGKTIFILNDIPKQDNTIEIEGMRVIALRGDLNILNTYK